MIHYVNTKGVKKRNTMGVLVAIKHDGNSFTDANGTRQGLRVMDPIILPLTVRSQDLIHFAPTNGYCTMRSRILLLVFYSTG